LRRNSTRCAVHLHTKPTAAARARILGGQHELELMNTNSGSTPRQPPKVSVYSPMGMVQSLCIAPQFSCLSPLSSLALLDLRRCRWTLKARKRSTKFSWLAQQANISGSGLLGTVYFSEPRLAQMFVVGTSTVTMRAVSSGAAITLHQRL
jgi:hypothetical protein